MSHQLKENSYRISIGGIVQGVGFRPFVSRLARTTHIFGQIANTSYGVSIYAQGTPQHLTAFIKQLKKSPPPLAQITRFTLHKTPNRHFTAFNIVVSKTSHSVSADLPSDIALCNACRRELTDPNDRRFHYPFINCTDCGPRFSITRKMPYDRQATTMNTFRMCPDCQAEYDNPSSRRFHAQPNACPVCGPSVELIASSRVSKKHNCCANRAMEKSVELLEAGNILAIKSIGGYHLCCNAHNPDAISRLRKRKNRPDKPFAVMVADIQSLMRLCTVNLAEKKLLSSPQAPIVLLKKKADAHRYLPTIEQIAPANAYLGVMLAYTPLHAVLFANRGFTSRSSALSAPCLIMTSGNRQDEPICRDEKDVFTKLDTIADYFLVHNRPIHNRCDDSIAQVIPGTNETQILRRSRGYVPVPLNVATPNTSVASVLAVGAELKNTFCLTRSKSAYPSAYIGDLDNQEALKYYRESVARMTRLLDVKVHVVAHDIHPDFMSTRFAREMKVPAIAVQHHHAHLASVCAEQALVKPVIGFSFDGTGLGFDGRIWGGECFVGKPGSFTRVAHLSYFALPGGDQATREIWRIAVSLAREAHLAVSSLDLPRKYPVKTISTMIANEVNTPLCSSVGRLFDGVAALIGMRFEVSFEAQAAVQLESMATGLPVDSRPKKGYNLPYHYRFETEGPSLWLIGPLVRELIEDKNRGRSKAYISYRFHLTLAEMMVTTACRIRKSHSIGLVVLSGGVFHNRLLLTLAMKKLKARGFAIEFNRLVPPNDGGIALGQAWTAIKSIQSKKE
jgi:hydrogenase maturation protein HypF